MKTRKPYISRLKIDGLKSTRNADYRLSPMTLILGPTGIGKTTVQDAAEIISTGQHHAGEKPLRNINDTMRMAGHSPMCLSEEFSDGLFIERIFQERNGKTSQTINTSIGRGGTTVQEPLIAKRLNCAEHFAIRTRLRGSEREVREMFLSAAMSISGFGVADAEKEIGELPVRARSEAKDLYTWLEDVAGGLKEEIKALNKRERELKSALREHAGSASEVGSLQMVTRLEKKLKELSDERDALTQKIGACREASRSKAELLRQRKKLTDRIDGLENDDGRTIDELQQELRSSKELVAATNNARTVSQRLHDVESEKLTMLQVAKAKIAAKASLLTKQHDLLSLDNCPTCGAEFSEDRAKQALAERKQAQEQLRQHEKWLSEQQAIVGRVHDQLVTLDRDISEATRNITRIESELRDRAEDAKYAQLAREQVMAISEQLCELADGEDPEILDELIKDNDSERHAVRSRIDRARAVLVAEQRALQLEKELIETAGAIAKTSELLGRVEAIKRRTVEQSIAPLSEAMAPFLGGLGRFDVQQENDKGTPVFRPGLIRNGIFIEIARLSTGQRLATIPALAMALATVEDRGGYQPIFLDDYEDLDIKIGTAYLYHLLALIQSGEVAQAIITWNCYTPEMAERANAADSDGGIKVFCPIPPRILADPLVTIINLWPEDAVEE